MIKIDRAFIDELGRDPLGNTLARTILQMASSLDIRTVAEGIETTVQLRELRRLGCDLGQGYLLSRPLETDALARRFGGTPTAVTRHRLTSRGRYGALVLRIGLVCPYSLSIPGGVQAQVLGLARELRRQGHEARVLGPCDGPPPASFVTPLGDSLPTAANGSIAPLAPDAAAALRTIRALNDEQFDVLHVHEPLTPGPSMTTLMVHPAPIVGTFHAAGRSSSYRMFRAPLEWFVERVDRRVVVSKDALALVQQYLGGEYDVLFNGVETTAIRAVAPYPRTRPAIFFIGRHEERKGLAILLAAVPRLALDVEMLGRRRWPAHRSSQDHLRPRPAHRVVGADLGEPRSSPASVVPRCSARRRSTASRSASCWPRRWPLTHRWSRAHSRATATWRPTGSTRCSSHPAIPTRWRPR